MEAVALIQAGIAEQTAIHFKWTEQKGNGR